MQQALVMDIQKHCIHDGPGIRTTVFLKGCPLRCVWCCNPESQSAKTELMFRQSACIGCNACGAVCPKQACQTGKIDLTKCDVCGRCVEECYAEALRLSGKQMTVADVLAEARKDAVYYGLDGGVTVSGGEPLLQAGFVTELWKACKQEHWTTHIETCGMFPWEQAEEALRLTDTIYMDIKQGTEEGHLACTGVSLKPILENLKRMLHMGCRVTMRIPVVKHYNASEESMEAIGQRLTECGYSGEIHLLPYHKLGYDKYLQLGRPYPCSDAETPERDELQKLSAPLRRQGFRVVLNGKEL